MIAVIAAAAGPAEKAQGQISSLLGAIFSKLSPNPEGAFMYPHPDFGGDPWGGSREAGGKKNRATGSWMERLLTWWQQAPPPTVETFNIPATAKKMHRDVHMDVRVF